MTYQQWEVHSELLIVLIITRTNNGDLVLTFLKCQDLYYTIR